MGKPMILGRLKSRLTCALLFFTLLSSLVLTNSTSAGACGTIQQERACVEAANAGYESCIRDMSWYNPGRLVCAIQHSFAVERCGAPCGGG